MQDKDYFYWHYKISTFFFMIPPKKPILKVLFWIIVIPHFSLICLASFLEFIQLCVGGSGDFSADVLNLAMAMLHIMGVNRVARWHFVKKDFDIVVKTIRGINLNYFDFNYPKWHTTENEESLIEVERNPIEEFRNTKLRETKRFSLKLCALFLSYVFINISVSYALNLYDPTYEKWNPKLNKTSVYRDYMYPLWYPFDTSISDGYYMTGFFYPPIAHYFLMSTFVCVDMLGINMIIHLTSHVDILSCAFAYVDKNIDDNLSFTAVTKLKEKRIIKCIKELQTIYSCASMLNNIICSELFIQIACMVMVICCSVYRITSVTLGLEVVYLGTMVMICTTEIFNVTWFNNGFTMKVFGLLDCVYELEWINYPPKLRRILLFLMKRLQKPFYFSMGSWIPLDLQVFLATMKASYSFYTLLTQSQAGTKLNVKETYD